MRAKHVGYLVVVELDLRDQVARPIGVLSDRDIVVGVVACEADIRALRVGDVMTERPVTASESDSVAAALNEMRRAGVRGLPVVASRGQLVGVVSLDDVLAELAGALGSVAGAIGKEQRLEAALRPKGRLRTSPLMLPADIVRFALSHWPVSRCPNRSRNHVHRARLRPVISRLLGEADLSAGCEIVKRTA